MDEDGDDIFDRLLEKQKVLRLKLIDAEIKRLESEFVSLQCSPCVKSKSFDKYSLQDGEDQRRIVIDMKRDLSDRDFEAWTRSLESIFINVDNIRYAYEQCGLTCPRWYREKYLANQYEAKNYAT
jgi:hypothetical protein